MPLPLRKLRVFPNPWTLITLDDGPQGALAYGGARNVGALRYLGSVPKVVVRESRDVGDPRGNDAKYLFTYPALDPSLTTGTPLELPAGDPFFHDRLHDGSLIPADEATAKAFPRAQFKSLLEARSAGIAEFESHFGPGSFAENFAGKPFVPSGSRAAPQSSASDVEAASVYGFAARPPDETPKPAKGGKSS